MRRNYKMFTIRKLTYYGREKETSTIELRSGLNIIYGPSNTGKTYVAETIDYMFGGVEFPLSEECGYTIIEAEIETENGSLIIRRDRDKNNTAIISSKIDGIQSNEYPLKSSGKQRKETLSDVWLKLLGVEEPTEIYRSEDLKTQAFTTRAFNQAFIIKEDCVYQKESIIKKDNASITSIKAALLYLINGKNYIIKEEDDNKTKATKRKALETYLNEQIGYIQAQKEELKQNAALNVSSVQEEIDTTLRTIEEHQKKLNSVLIENKEIYLKLNELNSALSEDQTLHTKYKALRSQYASDLKRLQLIIDGEAHSGEIKKPIRCPFCNGELKKHEEDSCIEAAKVEVENLIPKIKDLDNAEKELDLEINELKQNIGEYVSKRDTNNELINKELNPKLSELKKSVEELTKSIEASKEADMLLRFEDRYRDKLNELSNEAKEVTKFDPNELFGPLFISQMNELTEEMLRMSRYENYQNSYFDIKSFDLVVNGQTKKTQGKGFRAFLNTTLAFCLQTYMKHNAVHYMPLFVVDSPILTLREKDDAKEIEDKKIDITMKEGLMNYLAENSIGRQIIIIENEIPNIYYRNANIIQFTKDSFGRYGLLNSVRQ